jgi:hypothetical protein
MPTADFALATGQLVQLIDEYLADYPAAAPLEDGRVLFDKRIARYSVTKSHGRCLLRLWSEERNLMRTVVDIKQRAQCLRIITRRMGTAKPQALELVPTSDRRTPTARDANCRNYQRLLERVLSRTFVGSKVDGLRSAMDLEHSFGPAYEVPPLRRSLERVRRSPAPPSTAFLLSPFFGLRIVAKREMTDVTLAVSRS